MIELKEPQWNKILELIKKDYADRPSVYLLRSKMREELGFVPRWHQKWVSKKNGPGYYLDLVCLDFYNDAMETFFMIRYMNRDDKTSTIL